MRRIFLLTTLTLFAPIVIGGVCPPEVANGIDSSGFDYYDATRAACLSEEQSQLMTALFKSNIENTQDAWNLTHTVLCQPIKTHRNWVQKRIQNPVKTLTEDNSMPKSIKRRETVRASQLMRERCAFSPEIRIESKTKFELKFSNYSTGAYVGDSFIFEWRSKRWMLTHITSYVD